jgi:predicted dienelactone hydrolase
LQSFTPKAGLVTVSLIDERTGVSIPVTVLLPEGDAGCCPLVVISHGNGGSGSIYRVLAGHLARAGCVVAMLDHPGNTRGDNELARTVANLERRPRHLKLVIDWAFAAGPFAARLVPNAVALVGHSLGGYTALALAGGQPTASARETGGEPLELDVLSDERVRALVLLAPATQFFAAPGALQHVRVPVLMITAEFDEHTPAVHAEIVERGISDPALLEHRTIAGAGHFSFLDPFPKATSGAAVPPSQDPPGFDRVAFGAELGADVVAFVRRTMC